jgi:threonine aldolase
MGNLAALLSHCERRGDEAIVGRQSHVYQYEAGWASVLGGIAYNVVEEDGATGELPLRALEEAVRRPFGRDTGGANDDGEGGDLVGDPHSAPTRLVCLETTHNRCGGAVLSVEYLGRVRAWARANGLKVHLDGARLFNAAVFLLSSSSSSSSSSKDQAQREIQQSVREITKHVDSVTFCLSKGLGAPVGSLLCADRALVARARRWRKALGGGMRQVGHLAAPGLVALGSLDEISERLRVDHDNARVFAEGVGGIPGLVVDGSVQSNIVVFGLEEDEQSGGGGGGEGSKRCTHDDVASALAKKGVKVAGFRGRLRAVTSSEVDREQVESAVEKLREVMRELLEGSVSV